jgi:GT2 family glycosyltransferase
MKTTIIVPTYRRPAFLERLLVNLEQTGLPGDVTIHVVENGAPCGAEAICRKFSTGGRVRYSYSALARKSPALNRAIRASDADFLIFLDDDVQVAPSLIAAYIEAARKFGPGHFFGGPLVPDAEIECPAHLLPFLPRSAAGWSLGEAESELDASHFQFFFGANWAAFKNALLQVGLFTENLGVTGEKNSPVGEENELQERLLAAGLKPVYLPGALIYHYVPRDCYTLDWVRQRNFRLGVTDWISTHSRTPPRRTWFGIPPWIIRAVIQHKAKLLVSRLLGRPIEERTLWSIRDAYYLGILHGAKRDRAGLSPG